MAVRGVIFDMDGTLTVHAAINFNRMRERLAVPPGECLLSFAVRQQTEEARYCDNC